MIALSYDLHLHSCLSPCGDDDMTPANIVGMAAVMGLELIALTDHNSAKNCPAFLKMAEEYGILALPGMELTTEEEVHVVCLFSELDAATIEKAKAQNMTLLTTELPVFEAALAVNQELMN